MADLQGIVDGEKCGVKRFSRISGREVFGLLQGGVLERGRCSSFFYYSSLALQLKFFILYNKTDFGALWEKTKKWNYGQDV